MSNKEKSTQHIKLYARARLWLSGQPNRSLPVR